MLPIKRFFLIALLLPGTMPAMAFAPGEPVALIASSKLGADAFEHHFEGAASTGLEEAVVIKKRMVGVSTGPWRSFVWSVGPSGQLTHEVALNAPNQLPNADGPDVAAITRLSDGALVCALITEKGELKLARVTGNDVVWSTTNSVIGADLRITRMVQASDGNFILTGQRSGHATYLKIAPNGIRIWEHKPESEGLGVAFDAVPTNDGGAFVTAGFWNGDPYMIGESSVWIAKVDANGIISNYKKIPGRRPRIAPTGDGGFVLVYDKSTTVAQKITLQAYEKTLEPAWSTEVLSNTRGLETFKVVQRPGGGYIVAGGDDLKLFTAVFASDGKKLSQYKSDSIQSSDYNVVATGSEFFLIYPVISLIEANFRKQLNTKIQVSVFKVE